MQRVSEVRGAVSWNGDEAEVEPVMGHVLSGFTDGFLGVGRLVRLGALGLVDLGRQIGTKPEDVAVDGFLVAVPSAFYEAEALRETLRDAEGLPVSPEELAQARRQEHADDLDRGLLTGLASATGFRLPALHQLFPGGQSAFVRALEAGRDALLGTRARTCIVGGVDSMVQETTVTALSRMKVLKDAENPVGFMPGEAAAFLRLERADYAVRASSPVLAVLGPAGYVSGTPGRFQDNPNLGRDLAALLTGVLSAAPLPPEGNGCFLLGNLNGDIHHAREWGAALQLLPPDLQWAPHWMPAEQVGDTGAASGAVAACMAIRAFSRGYAAGSTSIVWTSGDDGARGAFRIHDPRAGAGA
jgi:3-oxoacyl-[acyl-carrier-protein] synthase-1